MAESGAIRLHRILTGQSEEGSVQESPPQARDLGRNYYRFDHWLRNRKW